MITYKNTLREKGGTSAAGAIVAGLLYTAIYVIQLIPGYFYMFN